MSILSPTAPVTAPAPLAAVKSMLARLLATENISVEHADVQTAAFDLRTRTLILPRWKDMSNALYDMLVGHEVSHALFTPQDGWRTDSAALAQKHGVSEAIARQYLNIAEDARIERLIKEKFPGLRADFYKGYGELHAKNFFGVTEAQMPSLSLADRVNLHSKLGLHVDAVVPFNADEAAIRDFVMGAKTWADTVTGADRMLTVDADQWKRKPEPQDEQPEGGADGEDTDGEEGTDSGTPEAGDEQSDSDSGEEQKSADTGEAGDRATKPTDSDGADGKPEQSQSGSQDTEGPGSGGTKGQTNSPAEPTGPVTANALEKAMKTLNETNSKMPTVIRAKMIAPSTDVIVPFATVLKDWETIIGKQRVNAAPFRDADFTRASASMATAFDRRKAADMWRRTTVAKSGSIDPLRMNQYRWSEDIFRKTTRIAEGKNHGIVILLDWSSSMGSIMQSTIGQLIILTDFCRTAGVPFEVYAFTDQPYFTMPTGITDPYSDEAYKARQQECAKWENRTHNFASPGHVRLLNFLSSRMTAPQYERMKSMLWNGWSAAGYDYRYRMGSTPTTAALHHASAVVAEFVKRNRIQIAHTIVLTDGEPTDSYEVCRDTEVSRNEGWSHRKHYVIEDSVTGASYDATDSYYYENLKTVHVRKGAVQWAQEPANRSVAIAIDALRRRTGSKVHWIGLIPSQSRTTPNMGGFIAAADNNWARDGFVRGTAAAWDTAVIAAACRFGGANNERYIEKHMSRIDEKIESAKTNRTLFNAVAEKQAMTNSLRSLATIIGEFLAV